MRYRVERIYRERKAPYKSSGMKSVKSGGAKTNKNDANTNNMFCIRMKLS